MLFSLWCLVCAYLTHIFLYLRPALHSLESNLSGLLTGWEAVHTCCLAVGKSSQGYLFWKETEKVVIIVSFERKAGIKQMFAWCYLFVPSARKQKCADSKQERYCHRLQLDIGSWGGIVLEGRGKGHWMGKSWNRWHIAQS